MKKRVLVMLALFAVIAMAHAAANAAPPVQPFKVGGVPIALTPPASEFVEVGNDNRERMEKVLVLPEYRLVSAFLLSSDIQRLNKHDNPLMSRYAMVQVSRQSEDKDCSPLEFQEGIRHIKESAGETDSKSAEDAEKERNMKLKSMGAEGIELDAPVQLGSLFSKEDAYGSGWLASFKQGSNSAKFSVGIVYLRVKNRLLYMYLYAEYKDEGTIKWLRDTMEKWADSMLKANR